MTNTGDRGIPNTQQSSCVRAPRENSRSNGVGFEPMGWEQIWGSTLMAASTRLSDKREDTYSKLR